MMGWRSSSAEMLLVVELKAMLIFPAKSVHTDRQISDRYTF
jgi:hypothetical protein